jgi:Domain of unknown function (DUF3854)
MMERSQSKGACGNDPLTNPRLDSWALSYLNQRGISVATGQASRLCSLSEREVAEQLDLTKESASCGGLGIPYFDEAGRLLSWRVRLQEGELRYLVKKGDEMRPYFPPFLEAARLQDTKEPLYIVESPIKALSLSQEGLLTVGLGGVDAGGLHKAAWRDGGTLELHPDFTRRVTFFERTVVLVFDAGAAINVRVSLALAKAATAFRKAGAMVLAARLPLHTNGEDQGPDDVKARLGVELLKERLNAAPPADPLLRLRALLELDSFRARQDGVRALLEELPVQAALYLGGVALRDAMAAEAKSAKAELSKAALAEFQKKFRQKLGEKKTKEEPKEDRKDMPTVEVTAQEHVVVEKALEVLVNAQALYKRGGRLVVVAPSETDPPGIARAPGAPIIRSAERPLLRVLLATQARFVETVPGKDELRELRPPAWVAEDIDALPYWPGVRPLTGIIETPAFLRDGSVLQATGYHADTGLLYAPNTSYPTVPESPTQEEITQAKVQLQEPFVDFPFETEAHASAALAGVLAPLCRWAFPEGNIPLHLIDANTRRAGKSLLADVIGHLVNGRAMARMTASDDEDETGKRLMALALAGDATVLIDNIPPSLTLGSGALDAALTARGAGLRNRALGSNERMLFAPWDVCLYATGNNVAIKEDTLCRVLQIRLNVPLEEPEKRGGFVHPDLLAWVREHRGRIVSAALTLCRAWHVQGRPQHNGDRWGGFDGWGDVVRSILVWSGYPDPALTRDSLAEGKTSPERVLLAALLDGWKEVVGEGELSPSAALVKLRNNDQEHAESKGSLPLNYPRLREAFGLAGLPQGVLPTPQRMGRLLEAQRKKVLDGRMLEARLDPHSKSPLWRVVWVKAQKSFGSAAGFAGFGGLPRGSSEFEEEKK